MPSTIEMTSDTANTRTPSASARVTRKMAGGQLADALSESAPHQFISGEHLAAEILRQEQSGDHDAGQQVAKHHDCRNPRLPAKASAGVPTIVSVLVSAETMESAMAHHGAVAAAQEIIAQALLAAAEARPKPGDAHQINRHHRQVYIAQLAYCHRLPA